MARSAKPAPANAKAKSPVGRKRNREGSGSGELQKRLAEALAQHAAIGEILNVMSASPSDVQPVLDAVAERAAHLCEAPLARVRLLDGDEFRAMAEYSLDGTSHARTVPLPLKRTTIIGRAVLDRATIHHDDVVPLLETEYPDALNARRLGLRAVLAVPLIREGKAYGVILLWRREPGLFSREQVALVQTFAQQAAIAVDNVRLFNETKEALEQQIATAEILRVISESPTDVQPVFDAIAEQAMVLCGGSMGAATRFDGELLHLVSYRGTSARGDARGAFPMPISRGSANGRAILDRAPVHIPDVRSDPEYQLKEGAGRAGWISCLSVPLLHEGRAIGAIAAARPEPGPFPEKSVALLETFARQAVLAIENVRLFNETKEALERQTATAEILKVIAASPGDVQPVFDAIAASSNRLLGGHSAAVWRFRDEAMHLVGFTPTTPEGDAALLQLSGAALDRFQFAARVAAGETVCVTDTEDRTQFSDAARALARVRGYRSVVVTPLRRESASIGMLSVTRHEPGQFTQHQIGLLETFADQAVIAIENVRLFTELEARTRELTRSVQELKALGEVGQAVSSTLDLETVLSTIVSRAVQLAGMDGGSIWEYDQAREQFYVRATDRLPDELVEVQRATPIRKGEGALGRLVTSGEPVEIGDIADQSSYQSGLREVLIRCGYRSVLAVPLLREDHLLGALAVSRITPGGFAPEVIALLKTFATQSALAIQNARLYREIEVKSRELEAASRHKSEFLANMSHELRTPLNAILGFSEILSERMFGEINEKQAEYLGDILQSGQHLLSLINDILDLSKIEAGRMELELSEFNLPGTIESTLTLVRERAVRHGIELGATVDESLGIVRADERKVKQVLLNLLSNALKFTPEGGRIDVRAAVRDGTAEILVTDTGVGISPEDQEAVFEEFRQVGTASKKVEGTGLGLAISRKFIDLHGGRMWVESQVGTGSTFAFTLPLQ